MFHSVIISEINILVNLCSQWLAARTIVEKGRVSQDADIHHNYRLAAPAHVDEPLHALRGKAFHPIPWFRSNRSLLSKNIRSDCFPKTYLLSFGVPVSI